MKAYKFKLMKMKTNDINQQITPVQNVFSNIMYMRHKKKIKFVSKTLGTKARCYAIWKINLPHTIFHSVLKPPPPLYFLFFFLSLPSEDFNILLTKKISKWAYCIDLHSKTNFTYLFMQVSETNPQNETSFFLGLICNIVIPRIILQLQNFNVY